jgi:2-dehydro-3-deoxyphosphogluconate aldolase / (4S)-4-hydroxy-2-oxoglutarate aldolase
MPRRISRALSKGQIEVQVIDNAVKQRIVPVIVLEDADDAVPLAEALLAGGLAVAEITFRTAAAEESIKRIASSVPGMLIGAGTVLTADQAERAIGAGARFLVAPGFNPENARIFSGKGYAFIPGVNSPSDIEVALAHGFRLMKFFPAEASGGLKFIDAVSQPYREVRFLATGGINASNLPSYLQHRAIAACGGSWMVDPKLVCAKQFDEIERLTREAVRIVEAASSPNKKSE